MAVIQSLGRKTFASWVPQEQDVFQATLDTVDVKVTINR